MGAGRIISLLVFARALSVSALLLGAADPKPPDDILASKGLQKVGTYYVLATDAEFPASLRALRKAEKQLEGYIRKRREIDRDIDRARASVDQWQNEMEDLAARRSKVPESDYQKYNALNDAQNLRIRWINDAQTFQLKRAEDRAKLVAPVEHITLTVALADKMEAAAEQYAQLASEPEVTAALNALSEKGGVKVRLGPSPQFKTELPLMRRKRDQLDAGALKMDTSHGVGIVNVTLNGSATVPMILDSGASFVCISSKIASEIGLDVSKDAGVVKVRIADGSELDVPLAMLSSVRVGKFVATDVVCAIMPPSSKVQDCLLGGSFLKNFQYQIDLGAGVLHLTPITATTVSTDGKTNATPPASQPSATTRPAATMTPATFTLTIIADIDGTDDLFVSAAGLAWKHGEWNWPANVVVNDAKWDPQAMPKLPPRGAMNFLDKVDWLSVQLEQKSGRGEITLAPHEDGLTIHFADGANGAGRYSLKLTLSQK